MIHRARTYVAGRAGGQDLVFLALDTALAADATPSNVSTIGSPFNILASAPNPNGPVRANAESADTSNPRGYLSTALPDR